MPHDVLVVIVNTRIHSNQRGKKDIPTKCANEAYFFFSLQAQVLVHVINGDNIMFFVDRGRSPRG
jgi:hypothetical protein